MYGLGNWGDVADHVGTQISDDCKEHYYDVYMNSPYFPLPVILKNYARGNLMIDLGSSLGYVENFNDIREFTE